jgi:hypothetical protein
VYVNYKLLEKTMKQLNIKEIAAISGGFNPALLVLASSTCVITRLIETLYDGTCNKEENPDKAMLCYLAKSAGPCLRDGLEITVIFDVINEVFGQRQHQQ